ncbi:Coiled-coil domain-containing protein 169 [Mytilus coruscus]|uniref:Coiled-coil domain-containing protein 169 n=1 Tax=Mytilus coruscus TaxID=42192 RepID=A0A6J8D7P7_MYTCO|nr:Coiled-coil domain-containing protein 169 [Mytilus coruscus]
MDGDFELEKIRQEIQQEKQMKEMLEQSAAELRATVEELENRYDTVDNEGNEWKTRYETQTEINEQLERQILNLQNKVQEAKSNLKDAGKTPRDMNRFDDLSDANPHMIRMLEKEKQMLSSQLRDLEWRLDQESKAYHKANDERKTYNLEINTTKHQHGEMSSRQRAMGSREQLDTISGSRTPRDLSRNIPEDQRIIDPKRGPIKKTAGVKNLPSLEMT